MIDDLELYSNLDDDLNNTDLRCLKCEKLFKNKDLIGGYCSSCATTYEKRCQECGKPVTKLEFFKFMGYCKMCHASWIKPNAYKINNGVETYPNTGV